MISKNKIKSIQQLSSKKQRILRKEFLVEGPKLFEEALSSRWEIAEVYATDEYVSQDKAIGNLKALKLFIVSEKDLQRIGNLENNKHVAAVVKIRDLKLDINRWKNEFSILLDNVKDPGNMGTIIRTASWFGIKNVICSENCVDLYNPKVIQATMGAAFGCNVINTNILKLCQDATELSDFPIFGAFMTGEDPKVINQKKKGFLVLGSESHGISQEIAQFVSNKICIAKDHDSNTESLNVAIANAILCYELIRH